MDPKQEVRERVWARLQEAGVARFPGARGRIPNFTGAERAAERLADEPAWRSARVLKSNPDSPQWPVRTRALREDKVVFIATPRLAEDPPFLMLDPARLEVAPRAASSIKGSAHHGIPAGVHEMPHVDLIVCGTVAVGRDGARVGKGGGYSDLEFALGVEHGVIDDDTVIATTVHPLQVLDEALPETPHDFRLDLIVTPDGVERAARAPRPRGIRWEDLDEEKIASIPILSRLRRMV